MSKVLRIIITVLLLTSPAYAGTERVRWTAQKHYSIVQKLNVIWWFGNDECQKTDTFVFCFVRNPMSNFTRYVIGIADQDHYITGRKPAMTVVRSDLGERGYQYAVSQPVFIIPYYNLPWLAYSGKNVEWYFGWQPWGQFAIKFNLLNSPFQLF